MTEHKVSSRYAKALFTNSQELKSVQKVYDDLLLIQKTLDDSKELRSLVNSPIVKFETKKKIYKEVFEGKVTELTVLFLVLLADKGRDYLIGDITFEFIKMYNELNNILEVRVTSANELNKSLKYKVVDSLSKWSNKKIVPEYMIDKSIKGGIKLRVDDWVYDASIQNQLKLLADRMMQGSEN